MAELVYRSVELRDFSTTNRWFEVVEGLYDGVQVRGVDVVIPALSGRYARNRIADFRVVRLHGWVYGDTEAAFRTNMEATMVAFNPVSDPANLVISTPLYGVASGTKTISARTVDVRIMQLSWLHAEVDAELHALGTPPDWI